MTTFTDGPAKGTTLLLTRIPLYMRIVRDGSGTIDALNLVDDAPKPDEVCTAYHLDEAGGTVCIDGQDKSGRRTGGIYRIAQYSMIPEQPPQELMRNTLMWQAWVMDMERGRALSTAENI